MRRRETEEWWPGTGLNPSMLLILNKLLKKNSAQNYRNSGKAVSRDVLSTGRFSPPRTFYAMFLLMNASTSDECMRSVMYLRIRFDEGTPSLIALSRPCHTNRRTWSTPHPRIADTSFTDNHFPSGRGTTLTALIGFHL